MRAGIGQADAMQIAGLVGGVVPLAEIVPGTRFDIVLGRRPQSGAPRAVEAINFRARFDLELGLGAHVEHAANEFLDQSAGLNRLEGCR